VKKIISLFQRNYETDRLARDEVVPGAEWVLAGEGRPTEKLDGTCCLVRDGMLWARYDCKGSAHRPLKPPPAGFVPSTDEYAPGEPFPNDHYTGWVPVGDETGNPQYKWHREAWANFPFRYLDGTYELVGPKVQGNPYSLARHMLFMHGIETLRDDLVGRTFDSIRAYLAGHIIEGIVWHHPDGRRMVKVKRRDFGLEWPLKR
jgi:hypothetical protein